MSRRACCARRGPTDRHNPRRRRIDSYPEILNIRYKNKKSAIHDRAMKSLLKHCSWPFFLFCSITGRPGDGRTQRAGHIVRFDTWSRVPLGKRLPFISVCVFFINTHTLKSRLKAPTCQWFGSIKDWNLKSFAMLPAAPPRA